MRVRVRGSWIVACVVGLLFVFVLLVAGWTMAEVGNDAHPERDLVSQSEVPPEILEGGPLVHVDGDSAQSTVMPPRTVALTFDDGPDPVWTPRVLEVLERHDVPATFFVVGSMAARYPELVRQIHESGSELGVHTFTHPELAHVTPWRVERELDQTQLVLAGAAGVTTTLFRPPYSSTVEAVDNLAYEVLRQAGEHGYVSVFSDIDSQDWQRPGVDAIVRNATPPDGQSGVVLLHDAGGDRSQTVAALDVLIPRLKEQGYRFTTITEVLGAERANPAPPVDQVTGHGLLFLVNGAVAIVDVLKWALLLVCGLTLARLVLLVFVARVHAVRRRRPRPPWGPPVTDPVSVIVPAYNEAAGIEATVRSAVASNHRVEVIVVDDGSTDGTADIVEALGLPQVRVLRRPNGGKAAALNAGIAAASHELVVMVDGDTVFEPTTIHELVQPFADPEVGAVSANVKIANRETLLARLQHIEYVIGFNVDRRVHDVLRSMPTVPGAGGAFRRSALLQVGGLSAQTLAEDTDLTIALGRAGWRTVFQEKAVTWTEAPTTVRQLWQQRYRWTFGTMQALWKHRRAVVQRGAAGRVGRFGLLHVVTFQILLPAVAPLLDVFLLYGLLFLDPWTTILLWGGMPAVQAAVGAYAFGLDGERRTVLWLLPAQQLVYRQLMYVVLLQSLAAAFSGVRVRWQHMRRAGTSVPKPEVAVVPAPRRPADSAAIARPTPPPRPVRERWLDVLRAAALARVMLYHTVGWPWLSMVFPAMGVMFAVGGSLMARSIDRKPPVDVVASRIVRLLPPLWVLAVVMVPLMLAFGWSAATEESWASDSLHWPELVLWIFPILDPPHSDWDLGRDAAIVLWYIRAYLWFVLLTPLLLRLFRRRPLLTILAPLTVVTTDALLGSPLAEAGDVGQGVLDFCTFGACWILGFAHRDGMLARMRRAVLVTLAVVSMGAGLWWAATHPAWGSYDLNEIPLAQALVSAGFVLVALRVSPSLRVLDRLPALGRFVTVVNSRAVTIYLWHNVAIFLAAPVLVWASEYSVPEHLALGVVLTVVAVLAFGWAEDLAARRRIALLPGAPPRPKHARTLLRR
ncbi:glycosyltransferase [Saccharomonospora sp. NB11]|jgi:cellulose synthase/poly-beta-1,6-N-acetylglucosamine synthase-like glycosyltransferase/peptidoglycan/xylan/chitin deacetylase (PgdA/CDA1 family)/peptidoglycan/LPS O-acetylase OafA/YrhL|uniref:glycosyltransferase n=1 Tax=Saccharomonospora sp. NB11 TaxID=1642298 RepID=UPI001E298DE6|nr:glycosyltransferase [Saccharomonospora sp. NB11]